MYTYTLAKDSKINAFDENESVMSIFCTMLSLLRETTELLAVKKFNTTCFAVFMQIKTDTTYHWQFYISFRVSAVHEGVNQFSRHG